MECKDEMTGLDASFPRLKNGGQEILPWNRIDDIPYLSRFFGDPISHP